MKKFLLKLCVLGLVNLSFTFVHSATLYEQLCDLNKYWLEIQPVESFYFEEVRFKDHEDLIKTHLELVEKYLRSNPPVELNNDQALKRSAGLDILNKYWNQARFPQNKFHADLRPYFIDDENTACAVGHIMRESGGVKLAEKISQTSNYAFIEDMNFEELPDWADEMGFSILELKWIQPSYGPLFFNVSEEIQEPSCGQENGSIAVQAFSAEYIQDIADCIDWDLWLSIALDNDWPEYEIWSQFESASEWDFGHPELFDNAEVWLPVLDQTFNIGLYTQADPNGPTCANIDNTTYGRPQNGWTDLEGNFLGYHPQLENLDAGVYRLGVAPTIDYFVSPPSDTVYFVFTPYFKDYVLNDQNVNLIESFEQNSVFCNVDAFDVINGNTLNIEFVGEATSSNTAHVETSEEIPDENIVWYNWFGETIGTGHSIENLEPTQNLLGSPFLNYQQLTNYFVEITGLDGCQEYKEFSVQGDQQYYFLAEIFGPSSIGGSDGIIDAYLEFAFESGFVNIENDFTYAWQDEPSNNSLYRSGLTAGTYYLNVSNTYGCSFVIEFVLEIVPEIVDGPTYVVFNEESLEPQCGQNNGLIGINSFSREYLPAIAACMDWYAWLETVQQFIPEEYSTWSQFNDAFEWADYIYNNYAFENIDAWLPHLDGILNMGITVGVNPNLPQCVDLDYTFPGTPDYEWIDLNANYLGNERALFDVPAGVYRVKISPTNFVILPDNVEVLVTPGSYATYILNDENVNLIESLDQTSAFCNLVMLDVNSSEYLQTELQGFPSDNNSVYLETTVELPAENIVWYNCYGEIVGTGNYIQNLPLTENQPEIRYFTNENLSKYYVEVTGLDGCKEYREFTILGEQSINFNLLILDPSEDGASDGSISLALTPYLDQGSFDLTDILNYEWLDDPSITTLDRNNLAAGTYYLEITTSIGCHYIVEFRVGAEELGCFLVENSAICDFDFFEILITIFGYPDSDFVLQFSEPFDSTIIVTTDADGNASFLSSPQTNLSGYELTISNGNEDCDTSIVRQMIDCSSGLSIELLDFYFTQSKDITELVWETASEEAGDYFILEQSTNGQDFSEVYNERVGENSNVQQRHNHLISAEDCKIFYRLKMQDGQSGKVDYSKVIEVNICQDSGGLLNVSLYPNPARDHCFVEFNSTVEAVIEVQLMDMNGKILESNKQVATSGLNRIEIDISGINSGVYYVKLVSDNVSSINKIIKM